MTSSKCERVVTLRREATRAPVGLANSPTSGTRPTKPDTQPLRRETIDYHPELWSRLGPTWSALLAETGESSAFLTVDWIGAWLEAFGPTARPRALVWRDGNGLAVGCTLLSFGTDTKRPLRIRCAYLNATGVPHASSEHNDVLVLPEHRDAVLEDLVVAVCEADVDELVLSGVREPTAVALRKRWPVQAQEGYFSEAPYVALEDLRATRTPYLDTLTSGARSRVRRSIRLYRDRFGPERIAVARPGEEALAWFGEMVTLHEARWRARGHPGSFQRPAARHFHEGLLARAVADPSTGLRPEIVRLSFGDEAIGFLYTLTSGGSVCFYQSGLKYHPDNRLKPGLVTHVLAAEYFLENGANEYDFLGGEPVPVRYKRSLSTDVRMLAWLHLPAPSLKMQTLYAVRRLVRALRSGGSGTDMVKAFQEPDITLVDGSPEPPALRGHDRSGPSARTHSRLAS